MVMRIYLAGDMRSGWQDRFKALLPAPDEVEIKDPRHHGLNDPKLYTKWDLDAVKWSDVIVAYMSPCNPSGFGMSLEVGYAHAFGKRIIFIDAMDEDWRSRYFNMLRDIAEVVPNLEAAVKILVQK